MIRRVGWATAVWTLLIWTVVAFAAGTAYDRSEWPHWRPAGTNCWDVRQEVLRRDSLEVVTWDLTTGACRVTAGLWVDPYTAKLAWIRDPAAVDIDHTLALQWVHEHGGAGWSREQKTEYANFLGYRHHLRALAASINRSKGAKGPADFKPETPWARCEWGTAAAVVIVIWDLQPEPRERQAIREHVAEC